jgi:hypothetical protein
MTEPKRPQDTEEAAAIVRNDPALSVATDEAEDDAATDEDARTPDTASTGKDK